MEYIFSDKIKNMKPSAIREIFKSLADPTVISLAAGNPSAQSFPVDQLALLSRDIFENMSTQALQYSVTEGYTPLRRAVAARMKEKFGIGRDFDAALITTGGQQCLDLSTKVLCNEGDVIVSEQPSFIGALNSFRSYNTRIVGVDRKEDGLDLEALENVFKTEKNVRMLYLIPTFHNPLGTTLPLENRKAIYALCKQYGVMIYEDNPYGELRFDGEDIPTLKSMDEEGIVIYSSSFSKILSAGMRIGYVIAPEAVMQKMVVAKQVTDVHTNIFFQILCHRYMTECDLDAHIESIRRLYGHKCGLMLDTLDKTMPKDVSYTRPQGGLFVWATLPESVDMNAFVKKAIENKVAVVPGTAFNCDESAPSSSFRLNYSTPTDEQIVKGIEILSATAKAML